MNKLCLSKVLSTYFRDLKIIWRLIGAVGCRKILNVALFCHTEVPLIAFLYQINQSSCLVVAKEEKQRESRSPAQAGLVSSSLLEESIVTCGKATTLNESVLELLSTLRQSWSTLLLKFSNWQATLHETTRRPGSTLVTCSLLSETTKN